MILELDRLLGGKILKDGWLRQDKMELIYPPGATYKDLNWDFDMVKESGDDN